MLDISTSVLYCLIVPGVASTFLHDLLGPYIGFSCRSICKDYITAEGAAPSVQNASPATEVIWLAAGIACVVVLAAPSWLGIIVSC